MVSVTEKVLAYQRKRLPDHEVIDLQALDLPETTFTTQALWYELGDDLLVEEFPLEVLLGSLHAAEHAQIAVLPLLAMCDRWDIGGLSTNAAPADRPPDDLHLRRAPGRSRHHAPGLPRVRDARRRRQRLISECRCESGCPSCVQSPKCGNLNEPLDKPGCAEMLARMLER